MAGLTSTAFTASRNDGVWQWRFSGGLAPVSMERFSEALKLPLMHGTLSGIIPAVSYAGGNLKVDGALLFKVFDGTVVVQGSLAAGAFRPRSAPCRLLSTCATSISIC